MFVSDIFSFSSSPPGWNLQFRRALFIWENDKLNELLALVRSVPIYRSGSDKLQWKITKDGCYSVNLIVL